MDGIILIIEAKLSNIVFLQWQEGFTILWNFANVM